jgi:hypothetical protein
MTIEPPSEFNSVPGNSIGSASEDKEGETMAGVVLIAVTFLVLAGWSYLTWK